MAPRLEPAQVKRAGDALIAMLENVFFYDHLFLGGGNSRCVDIDLPKNVSVVSNEAGVSGGAFVWLPKKKKKRNEKKKN